MHLRNGPPAMQKHSHHPAPTRVQRKRSVPSSASTRLSSSFLNFFPQQTHKENVLFFSSRRSSTPDPRIFPLSLSLSLARHQSHLQKERGRKPSMTMAPVDGSTEITEVEIAEATAAVTAPEKKPISTIVIIIAMQTEALPLVNKFQLSEDQDSAFPKGVPWVRYHGIYKDLHINIIWPGKDPSLGVDSIGTISASLVTYASIQTLKPDLIINAGTAGGFKAKGACIGNVFLASHVAFHDRRIPIPVFDQYGIGARKTFSAPNILKGLNLKEGKLSTGDSLDMSPQDEAAIMANDATVKDMEGAAVAYVADVLSVPAIFVKAVTDIVDGDKPTAEEFLQNLAAVAAALDQAVTQILDFINGKCLSEL